VLVAVIAVVADMPLRGSPANRFADDGNWRLLDEPELP